MLVGARFLLLHVLATSLAEERPQCHEANHSIPPTWIKKWRRGSLLYAEDESKVHYHAMIGNGVLATTTDPASRTLFVAGVFNGVDAGHLKKGEHLSHRAAVPHPLRLMPQSHASRCQANAGVALDMEQGMYIRRSRIAVAKPPASVILEQRLYAHRAWGSLLVNEYLAYWNPHDGPHVDNVSITNVSIDFEVDPMADAACGDFASSVTEHSLDVKGIGKTLVSVWKGTTLRTEKGAKPVTVVVAVPKRAAGNFTRTMKKGKVFAELAIVRTSLDALDVEKEALQDLARAIRMHETRPGWLHKSHVQAWRTLWQRGVEVEGRSDVTKAVKSSMYFILSSLRPERPHSLSPGGLASNGYSGHTFWDTETWMYPPLLVWYPEMAASLLHYRWSRLWTAAKKARSYNPPYRGVMFPWESASSGVETCPQWVDTGRLEQHISADVALAVRQYYYMTSDVKWLEQYGYELLAGVADFWVSRAATDDTGAWHIKGIVPPDEYAHHVDDSPYTNYAVKQALLFASEAARLLGKTADPQWMGVANGLVLLFDGESKRHPEYQGYRWGTKIKQADIVLLPYPLGMEMDPQVRINDLEYYAGVTDEQGPAMTWGMHALGYIEVGQLDKAAKNFNRSFANVKEPFLVWTETPNGGVTNFITGAGGFLQVVLFGYAGLRIHNDHMEFSPTLMEGSTKITIRAVWYMESCISIIYDRETIEVFLIEGYPLRVRSSDGMDRMLQDSSNSTTFPAGSKFTVRKLRNISSALHPAGTQMRMRPHPGEHAADKVGMHRHHTSNRSGHLAAPQNAINQLQRLHSSGFRLQKLRLPFAASEPAPLTSLGVAAVFLLLAAATSVAAIVSQYARRCRRPGGARGGQSLYEGLAPTRRAATREGA